MSGLTPTWKRLAIAPARGRSRDSDGDQDYELLNRLGRGGMASVYLARQRATGLLVAIKVVDPDDLDDFTVSRRGEVQQRLVREARAVASIRHPNIVEFLDAGLLGGNGSVFIAMEYLEGCTLRDALRERGTLASPEVAAIGAMIARGVAAAHAIGIVHRDLKPSNVMLVPREPQLVAKVFDFGIAKLGTAMSALTLPGTVLGTPYYMSPEQCRGAADVDHRSDIYSLGIVLYVALAGRCPFQGRDEARVLRMHQTAPVPPLAEAAPGAPRELVQLVERCLAKAPDQRPQSMASIAAVLEAFAGPTGQPWRLGTPPLRALPPRAAARPSARAASYATPPTQAIRAALPRRGSHALPPVVALSPAAPIAMPEVAPVVVPVVVAPAVAMVAAAAVVAPVVTVAAAAIVDPAIAATRRHAGARLHAPAIGPTTPIAVVPARVVRRRSPIVALLAVAVAIAGAIAALVAWPRDLSPERAPVASPREATVGPAVEPVVLSATLREPAALPAAAVAPREALEVPTSDGAPGTLAPIPTSETGRASPSRARARHRHDRGDDVEVREDDGAADPSEDVATEDALAPDDRAAPRADAPAPRDPAAPDLDVRDPDNSPEPRAPVGADPDARAPAAPPRREPPRPPSPPHRERRDFERLVF